MTHRMYSGAVSPVFVPVNHGPASEVADVGLNDPPKPPDTQNWPGGATPLMTFAGSTSVIVTAHPDCPPQFENPIWKHTADPGYCPAIGTHDVSVAFFHSTMHSCGESVTSTHPVDRFCTPKLFVPVSVSAAPPPDGRLNVADAKFVSNCPDDTEAQAPVPASSAPAIIPTVSVRPMALLIRSTARTARSRCTPRPSSESPTGSIPLCLSAASRYPREGSPPSPAATARPPTRRSCMSP